MNTTCSHSHGLSKKPELSSLTSRTLFYGILLFACAGYLFYIWRNSFMVGNERYFSLFDDAMIAMRYAHNLAQGHGLRWNPGEPPVEGYTNLLWTLYMALIHLFPIAMSKTSLAVMLSGVAVLVGNIFAVRAVARELVPEDPWAHVASSFLAAFYFPMIFWTLRGMEVGILALFILLGVLLVFRLERRWNGGNLALLILVLGAALLTRPDAVIPAGIITLYLLVTGWRQGVRGGLAIVPLGLLAVCAGVTIFRIAYYGEPVPNTYYLKVGGVSLWERVSLGSVVLVKEALYHFWPALLVTAAGLIWMPRQFRSLRWYLLGALILAQAAYSVYVGGDAWEWMNFANRYLAIVVPLLFIVTARVITLMAACDRPWARFVLPLLGIGFLFQGVAMALTGEKFAAIALVVLAGGMALGGVLYAAWNSRKPFPAVTGAWLLLLGVFLPMNFFGYASWITHKNNGYLTQQDAMASRMGLQWKATLDPGASIAVLWGGAIPYFSELRAIDLLGKSDPVVARGKPHRPFWPGHSKWDYAYSIGTYHPDVVQGLWKPTPEDEALMLNSGYEKIDGAYYSKDYLARFPLKPTEK